MLILRGAGTFVVVVNVIINSEFEFPFLTLIVNDVSKAALVNIPPAALVTLVKIIVPKLVIPVPKLIDAIAKFEALSVKF
ncbi:hypothetical protein [Clostridium saccharobutylicum]|uniref:Uncharacterized protein n=1 Tax=Clostridium saccharobutylicum DSM 13864 TaxID=1345695 RepID=U5MRH8_CLOSA|nr:hypothetical protein [Clostridium saccharobutylicum]AGX43215.1 hypothetical protein CLSA_c22380 [Clostridium saccharobutylicum DSM 13864]AQR90514.1 hypothetical protein CLOSC_22330 [Clostridium saccharobutylicum]AQS00420.1 hypothetical protein CSACC_22400 [Clostridium saccharobutylicum]AQS10069.1 hypothetical protein CLOBY_22080 [Clostridium saccharobutylicum]AQS14403.1 hypothetical protein CLOSACC_22400 [Clostridium saccharobutylicum]